MEKPKRFQLQWEKLKAAVTYLAESSLHDDNFGETKLVNLLYYADCAAYFRTGRPITGSNYVRRGYGLCPEDWRSIAEQLEREEVLRVDPEDSRGSHPPWQPASAGTADTHALTKQERAFLDEQLRRFAGFNAAQIEEYSHDEVAWRTTEPGRVIPWELTGFRMPKLTDDVKERGQRIADHIRKHGRRVTRVLVERQDVV